MAKWKYERIKIATFEEDKAWKIRERDAWCLDGLAVLRNETGSGWQITHISSGYSFNSFKTFKRKGEAIEAAERILQVTDWTQSRTKLTRPASKWKEIVKAVKKAAKPPEPLEGEKEDVESTE